MSLDTVDTFGLALPPDWVRFPLARTDFEAFVRGQRRRLADDGVLDRTAQRRFELMMRQIRNDCRRSDVSLAASLHVLVDDASDIDGGSDHDAGSGLLAASVTVSAIRMAELGANLPLTVHTVAAAMGRRAQPNGGTEIANLEPPRVVDLPAGSAVRVVRLHTLPAHDASFERLRVFVQHVMVPFDSGRRLAIVTFSTPSVEHARELSELFDEMAWSFRMYAGDDLTDPPA